MKNLFSNRFPPVPSRAAQRGSTLLAALCTVTVLSMVAGCVLASISARYNSAYRSAAWNDALLAAEAGVDATLADVAGLLPDVQPTGAGLGSGYFQDKDPLKLAQQIQLAGSLPKNGTLLTFKTDPLVHGGEGGTTQQANISLEALPLSQLLGQGNGNLLGTVTGLVSGNDLSLLRVRSVGTALLPGGTVAGPSRLDNELWRVSLLVTPTPSVSRQVEVILRPVYPFESAVNSNDAILALDGGTIFDSFNSSLAAASTNGEYDSAKRLSNGSVLSNGPNVAIGGKVYGDIGTGSGNVLQDGHLTGTANNASFVPLPPLKVPALMSVLNLPALVIGTVEVPAGPSAAPAQYVLNGINSFSKLHVTNGGNKLNTNVAIYVNGDITGGIEVDSGVTAKVFVAGSIYTAASRLQNDSRRAANLQIYGVPATGSTPTIRLTNDANLFAAIYAPGHAVYLNGNNDLSGAVVAARFEATGAMRVHYDEALALNIGPALRYKVVSWREITN